MDLKPGDKFTIECEVVEINNIIGEVRVKLTGDVSGLPFNALNIGRSGAFKNIQRAKPEPAVEQVWMMSFSKRRAMIFCIHKDVVYYEFDSGLTQSIHIDNFRKWEYVSG